MTDKSTPLPNLAYVSQGVWRGGQPTAAGWRQLKAAGITNIVKLNTKSEAKDDYAAMLGMKVNYYGITVAQQLDDGPPPLLVREAVAQMKPGTYVHCQHGQDRTGLIVGVYRVQVQHWTKARAYDEMKEHGFHTMLFGLFRYWQEQVKE